MIRLISILFCIFAFFWLAKKLFRYFLGRWLMNLQSQVQSQMQSQVSPKANDLSEKLVQCAHCHTFVPQIKAIEIAQRFYCSQEHAKL